MDRKEILKRWATYWQYREPEIIALMGLSSHFDITLIPAAEPISTQRSGWFLHLPLNTVFLQIQDFRNVYSHSMSLVIGNTSLGVLKALLCSHSALATVFNRLLLWVISSAVFYFARFLFLIMSVFLHVVSVQSNACHLHSSYLNWEHAFQAFMYPSKVSKGKTTC